MQIVAMRYPVRTAHKKPRRKCRNDHRIDRPSS